MKSKQLLLTVLCCTVWFAAFSAESEPNDTKSQANTLTLNGSNTGVIGTATDVDWWKLITTSDGQISVTLAISNGLYCYAALYDNNGTTLITQNYTNGTSVVINQDGLAAGTYFIKVYPFTAGQMPAYTISNALTTAAVANDVEPNDTYPTSLTLALNGSSTGHVGYYYKLVRDTTDWYKVTTTGNGKLTITLVSGNGQYIY